MQLGEEDSLSYLIPYLGQFKFSGQEEEMDTTICWLCNKESDFKTLGRNTVVYCKSCGTY